MKKNILLTIIPKGYWITLTVAIFFAVIGGEYLNLALLLFNLLIFLIGLKLAVLIHEVGHLTFAKLVGAVPRRMILGKGHLVAQTEYQGIKIILNSNFNSGLAYAAFDNLKFIRLKLLAYTSGGFLVNFFVGFALLFFFDFSLKASEGIQLSSAIAIANILTGISALIPYYTIYNGLRLATDGLSILKIPFYKRSSLLELRSVSEQLDAYELYESKKYLDAIDAYELFKEKTEDSKAVNLNLSICYMKLGKFQKALELLEELLPLVDQEPYKTYKSFIYNGLGWEYLLQNRLEDADKYSELAYKIDPNSEYIRGTRASILIEKGRFEEGKSLLIDDVDFAYPNNQTLSASIYLGLAFTELNKRKEAAKYLKFVDDNLHKLGPDEQLLNERTKEKIAIHNSC